MSFWISFTLVSLVLLLAAESRASQRGKWLTKPLASTGFLCVAYTAGAFQSAYGISVFVALVLSWLGDVLLIPRLQRSFLFGLISFLLGHLVFGVAFARLGLHWLWTLGAVFVTVVIAVAVMFWLKSYVKPQMKIPVMAYIVVISSMVVLAVGSYGVHGIFWIPLGAILFYLSDLAVARYRFVAPAFVNRLWGLPCYYGSQLIFAYSCSLFTIGSL